MVAFRRQSRLPGRFFPVALLLLVHLFLLSNKRNAPKSRNGETWKRKRWLKNSAPHTGETIPVPPVNQLLRCRHRKVASRLATPPLATPPCPIPKGDPFRVRKGAKDETNGVAGENRTLTIIMGKYLLRVQRGLYVRPKGRLSKWNKSASGKKVNYTKCQIELSPFRPIHLSLEFIQIRLPIGYGERTTKAAVPLSLILIQTHRLVGQRTPFRTAPGDLGQLHLPLTLLLLPTS